MTRARDELHLCVPLKFQLTQQSRDGDGHVYGARSRFVTEKLLKTLEEVSYHGSQYRGDLLCSEHTLTVDVGGALKDMW
jgi:DNA helicase-2/ATP-dependent DNA helicase PcrA